MRPVTREELRTKQKWDAGEHGELSTLWVHWQTILTCTSTDWSPVQLDIMPNSETDSESAIKSKGIGLSGFWAVQPIPYTSPLLERTRGPGEKKVITGPRKWSGIQRPVGTTYKFVGMDLLKGQQTLQVKFVGEDLLVGLEPLTSG